MIRRLLVGAVLVVLAVSLSSCSPADRVGIALHGDGQVSVLNCGVYIQRVEILAPGSDEVLWSAAARPRGRSASRLRVDDPPDRWDVEGQVPEPLSAGSFVVATTRTDPTGMTSIPVSSLERGRVVTESSSVALGNWDDSCNAFFWGTPGWVIVMGVAIAGAAGIAIVMLLVRYSRRPLRRPPPSVS